jgi:plasmid stabilization system protein ParE
MNPRWEESEFVFGDLQTAARFIHQDNPIAARLFLEAAYNTFEFLASNPGIGRQRADLGFPGIRSWRIGGFRRYLMGLIQNITLEIHCSLASEIRPLSRLPLTPRSCSLGL